MWVRMMTQLEIIMHNVAISTHGHQCRSLGRNSTTETVQYYDLVIVFKHDAYKLTARLG